MVGQGVGHFTWLEVKQKEKFLVGVLFGLWVFLGQAVYVSLPLDKWL